MKYYRLDGHLATSDDPLREIFYSAYCGYWTDDWSQLKVIGVPGCPMCGCPGYQTTYDSWMKGAEAFESDGHPDYVEFLLDQKEICNGRGFSFLKAYEKQIAKIQ